jgi:hypothetical protein
MYYREQSFTRWLLMAFAAFILTACGGGGGSGTVISGNTPAPTSSTSTTYAIAVVVAAPAISSGSTTTVTATLTDNNGAPVQGATITFAFGVVGSSFGTLNTSTGTTTAAGVASVTLQGTAVGSGNVKASFTDAQNVTVSNSAPFSVIAGNTILVAAASSSVKSGSGTSNADVISAFVTDASGGALAGQTVQFSVPNISAGSFSTASTQVTDASGLAKATFLPSSVNRGNQTVTITATTTALNGTTSIATINVNVVGTTIQLSAPQTNLSSGATSNVTATLIDGSGNAISGQQITFQSTGLVSGSSTSVVSDASGQASVTVTATPDSPGGTVMSVKASAIGASSTYSYAISTSSLTVTATTGSSSSSLLPVSVACTKKVGATDSPAPYGYPTGCTAVPDNGTATASTATTPTIISIVDKQGGTGVAETVYLTTTLGYFFVPVSGGYATSTTVALTTDSSGKASVILASRYAGAFTIQANNAGNTLQTAVNETFVAGTPTQIVAQPAKSVLTPGGQTLITATVRDAIGNPAQGLVVTFNKQADDSNGSLSAPTATTDVNGQASVTFTAGGVSGATNGVQIQATVQQFSSLSSTALLTIGTQAVNISIGATNVLTPLDPVTYAEPFNVIVTNSSGQPVANQQVTLKVYPVKYYKGFYTAVGGFWVAIGGFSTDSSGNSIMLPPTPCSNEDLNLNGTLDPSENDGTGNAIAPEAYPGSSDTTNVEDNKDGKLWPGSPATLSSGTVTTNANGEATYNVIYARSYGSWLALDLVATTQVAGSESSANRIFDTSIITSPDDLVANGSPPGGINSPFGANTLCRWPLVDGVQ